MKPNRRRVARCLRWLRRRMPSRLWMPLVVAVLLLGLPIVLIARGVLEAIGWLFGVSIQ